MAPTIKKRPRRSIEKDATGAKRFLDEWLISGAANCDQAEATPGMAQQGHLHPDDPRLLVTRVNISEESQGVQHWVASIESIEIVPPGQTSTSQVIKPQISRRFVPVRVWRVDGKLITNSQGQIISAPLRFPTGLAISFPPQDDNDIQGVHVDTGGEPVDYLIIVHQVRQRVILTGPVQELVIDAMLRRRNATPWRGYPAGKALFTGADSNEENGRTIIDFEFWVDQWWHLRQKPKIDPETGEPLLMTSHPSFPHPLVGTAAIVNWWQPFPGTANFNALGIPGGGSSSLQLGFSPLPGGVGNP